MVDSDVGVIVYGDFFVYICFFLEYFLSSAIQISILNRTYYKVSLNHVVLSAIVDYHESCNCHTPIYFGHTYVYN